MFRYYTGLVKDLLASSEPLDCFKLQFKALQIIGVIRASSTNVFLRFLPIIPTLLVIKLWVTSAIYLISDDVSLEDKLQGSFTANTSLLCVFKMYYVHKHQKHLINFVKTLKSTINDLNEEETNRILKKEAIYPTAAGYLTLQLAIILSVSTYTLFPVGKNNENKPLPVFAWYPHYMNDGTPYKVTYFLQAMSIFTAGSLWEITNYAGFIAQVAILGVIVSTLFVQSWMSEQICAASLGLLNKAVESNFVDMDARTTKALLVFMTGLSNTTYIEVGTILKVRVNLKMFVTIIDFAYKCLALLKTAV
ncbi:hypothetical protein Bhyg_14614 [Pseudolycoriella hygida]|uniref:Odorant receptor n=1 Tax=Pseudolycoriella hygida TaxID=35572 RepID=A0A9Q0RXD0_9DIPT|nr:hypothetical protein Bhyg_14614 [Pseudolycoriella hygida]